MVKKFSINKVSTAFRFLARLTDYCLLYIGITFFTSCLPYFLSFSFYLGIIPAIPFLWIPVEAFLISRYATTPGKSLFGIRVRAGTGGKLPFAEALKWAAFVKPRPGAVIQTGLHTKRKIIALAVSACCILMAIFGKPLTYYSIGLDTKRSNNGWMQYYSLTRGFTVNFPNDPKEQSKQIELPDAGRVLNYEEVSTQHKKNVLYSVSYMELPSKWRLAGSNTLLKGALDMLVKHSPIASEIVDKELILYQNHRALDFRLKQGDNEVRGRFVLVDNTLYKLTVVYPSSLHEEVGEGSPFLDSFDLHPKGISDAQETAAEID